MFGSFENNLLALLGFMTVLTFVLYAIDKGRAIRGKWRIPEATLLGCSIFGGAIGGLLGMYLTRHKTKHWYFRVVNLCFSVAYVIVIVWLIV